MGTATRADVAKWAAKGKVKKLVKALDAADSTVCEQAAEALSTSGDPRAVEPLLHYIEHGRDWGNAKVRVVSNLGASAGTRAIPLYLDLLGSGSGLLPEAAAAALDKMGPDVVEPLIGALASENKHRRHFAAQLLGNQRDKRAVQPLCELLFHEDGNTRLIAAGSLARIGDPAAIPALRKAVNTTFENDYAARDVRSALASLEKGTVAPETGRGGSVRVTVKIAGAMHGSVDYVGDYPSTLPLDTKAPELLNAIAKSIIWGDQVRFYTGYQLVCPHGVLRSGGDGAVTRPTTLAEAGVRDGDVVELLDWGGSFL
jgi:HEAT repeat protein